MNDPSDGERSSSSRRRAKSIFFRACELRRQDQGPFVRARCGGDEDLFRGVMALLAHDAEFRRSEDVIAVQPFGRNVLRSLGRLPPLTRRILLASLAIVPVVILTQCTWSYLQSNAYELCALRDSQVQSIQAWEAARMREVRQIAAGSEVREIAAALAEMSDLDDSCQSVKDSEELRRLYEVTDLYSSNHNGAAVHLVNRRGVVIADSQRKWIGCSVNAFAFKFLVPAFRGQTLVTPGDC